MRDDEPPWAQRMKNKALYGVPVTDETMRKFLSNPLAVCLQLAVLAVLAAVLLWPRS